MKKYLFVKCRYYRFGVSACLRQYFGIQALIIRAMRIAIFLTLTCVVNLYATGYSQKKLTLSLKDVKLSQVFKIIQQQTHYQFLYNDEDVQNAPLVSVVVKGATVPQILTICFTKNYPLGYRIEDSTVVVLRKPFASYNIKIPTKIEIPQFTVTGKVTDSLGNPLIGVTVSLKGTQTGTITDANGNYSLTLESGNGALVFSYVGYTTKEIAVNGRTSINISLSASATSLDQLVVVGFGTEKKGDLTGSIASINSKDIENLKGVYRADQALMGKAAGVQVKPVSGAPGAAPRIRIRGIGSISAGSDPLFIVDGVPTDNIQTINPNDIASINVLKDASATAIYGSRGANGVVIISTKKGVAGKTQITFTPSFGFQQVTQIPPYMNAKEQANWAYYGVLNRNHDLGNSTTGAPNTWEFPVPQTVLDVLSGKNTTDIKMVREMMRTAPHQRYGLKVSGGSEKIQYYISGGYLNQQGIIKNSGFKRYTLHTNFDAQITDRLNIGLNLNPSYSETWGMDPSGTGYGTSILGNAASIDPYNPLRNEDGSYFIFEGLPEVGNFPNPLALVNEVVSQRSRMRIGGNINLKYDILDGLDLNVLLSGNLNSNRSMEFVPNIPSLLRGAAYGQDGSSMRYKWYTEYRLDYNHSFGKHNLTGLIAYTAQKSRTNSNSLESDKFPNNIVPTLSAVGGLLTDGSSDIEEWSLISYLARLNYNYNNKYFLTTSIRTDGSSRFGLNEKYGIFPSVALAWRISNEQFLKNVSFLSNLKLRASFGETGNNNIGNYQQFATIENVLYPLGDQAVTGYIPAGLPNPDLTWEKKKEFDGGIDAGFFKDRVRLTVDYFNSRSTDLLLNVNIPEISGFSNTLVNIGKIRNTGWEFTLNTVNLTGTNNFQWTTDLNFSTYRNKVLKLGPKGDPIINNYNITEIGKPIGMFYGLLTDGIFKTQKELDEGPIFGPGSDVGTHVGDIRFKDLSGPDGKPDGIINNYDKTIMGSPYPDFYYGMTNNFSYNNFSLSISLQGVHGNKIMSSAKRVSLRSGFRVKQLNIANNFWKSEDDPGKNPRPNDEPTGGIREISQRYLDTGSYLRINNILLSYRLSDKICQNLNISSFQIYIDADNAFTFTNNIGFSPDVSDSDNALTPGIDNNDYPLAKNFTLGVNVVF